MVFSPDWSYKTGVATKSDLIEETIRNANRSLESAVASGSAEAITRLYTEDAQLLPTGSDPISGPGAITEFWKSILKLGIKRVRLESIEIDTQGATVIELGRYTLFGDGNQVLDRGKYIVIWKLIKGEWKLHRDIWNTSVAPNP
jgi:ketosteroid isomerase-like protein